MSQSTAQSRHRHQPALGAWAGLDWCVAAAACRSALDEFGTSSPRPTWPFSSDFSCTASPLQQRPTRHRRASIAMQWQVLERECSSRMPCPDVAVDARGPCAHYTDWRPRSRHQHLLCGLSWLTFVSQPTRSPCPARVPPNTTISDHIAASRGSKWSYSWASCSPRPLWRCLPGLQQSHSHCTACGCVISSAAAPVAPHAGTEHLSSMARVWRVLSA